MKELQRAKVTAKKLYKEKLNQEEKAYKLKFCNASRSELGQI